MGWGGTWWAPSDIRPRLADVDDQARDAAGTPPTFGIDGIPEDGKLATFCFVDETGRRCRCRREKLDSIRLGRMDGWNEHPYFSLWSGPTCFGDRPEGLVTDHTCQDNKQARPDDDGDDLIE